MTIKLLTTVLLSYVFIKILIKYAHLLQFLDHPNDRSHHCSIIPSAAGIGFVSAMLISMSIFEFALVAQHWYIFTALLMVFTIGVLDDRHGVSARWKFALIFAAVFVMWLYGTSIFTLGVWFTHEITLTPIPALIFTMFAVSGFTNALNLIDGIDGLAGSISLVILAFFALLALENNNHLMLLLSLFTMASVIGFLFLNYNPAKIFMGDSGSLSLGFIISILAILSLEYIHPITILYLTAIPVLDTLIVMIRRIRRENSPFHPDKTHLHHILIKYFDKSAKKTVLALASLQLIFSSIGYLLAQYISQEKNSLLPFIAIIGFAMLFVLFYKVFTRMKKQQAF